MSDKNIEVLEPSMLTVTPSNDFRETTKSFERRLLKLDAKDDAGRISSLKILNAIQEWEDEWYGKVTEEESRVLELVSLVVGTVDASVNLSKIETKDSYDKMRKNSAETQREAVRILFQNLDEGEKPNKVLMRTMSLITSVFENTLYEKPDNIYAQGLRGQINFWQGVMGMVTAAEMFRAIGWKVALGKVEWDLDKGVDLVVLNPEGKVFVVDVTEKMDYERENKMYKVEVAAAESVGLSGEIEDLAGVIKINVPPLRSQESEDFYEPSMRSVGYPKQEKINYFKSIVSG